MNNPYGQQWSTWPCTETHLATASIDAIVRELKRRVLVAEQAKAEAAKAAELLAKLGEKLG